MHRIDDPTDNNGRGWRQLSGEEVAAIAYLAIRLCSKGVRANLAGRNAAKADEAAMILSKAVAERLRAYPTFGPVLGAEAHSAAGQPKEWW
jgi:hypothetical protein